MIPLFDKKSGYWGLVNRLGAASHAATDLDGFLSMATCELCRLLGVARSAIVLRQADGVRSRADYCAQGVEPGAREKLALVDVEMTRGIKGRAGLLEITDFESKASGQLLSPGLSGFLREAGLRPLLVAPLTVDGSELGSLILYHNKQRRWTGIDKQFVEAVASSLTHTVFRIQSREKARSISDREALLSKLSSTIHGTLDSDALLQSIVTELGAALGVCRCRLVLIPDPLPEALPVTHEYVAPCCANRPQALRRIPVTGNRHLKVLLESPNPVESNDIGNDPRLSTLRDSLAQSGVKSLLSSSIRLGGRAIGVLSLHHCEQNHAWTQWEIDVVQSVSEQAAVAIRQAELYREARESAKRAALVNQIVASIRRSLDLRETLQVAVEEMGKALGANLTHFRQIVGDEVQIVAEHVSGNCTSMSHLRASRGNYLGSVLNDTRRTLVLEDVRAFIAAHPEEAATVAAWQQVPFILSQILCPIFVNDQLWGSVSIGQTDQLRQWTANEIAIVEDVTAQIAVAISHSNLFEEAKQSARVESLISHIIHGINQSNRIDEIYPVVAEELCEHLGTDSILIARHRPEDDLWTIECEYSNRRISAPGRRYRDSDFLNFSAHEKDGLILSDDTETDARFVSYLDSYLRPAGTRAFMNVRVFYNDTPRLAITAIMKNGPRAWTVDEANVMRAAANQVLIALERAELFDQVSRGKNEWETTFDALTDGIFIFDQRGQLRRVNKAAADFEGVQARELIGRRCCQLMQGIEAESCRVAQVIDTGRAVTFELVPEKLGRPVLVTISPLLHDTISAADKEKLIGDGEDKTKAALGAVCIVRDLTELRTAEAEAREQRSFLIKLIEHANDSIFALSPDGRLIWFNERLIKFFGYTREEMEAGLFRQFIPPGEKRRVIERFNDALAGEAQTFEMRALKKNGEQRLLLITYTPIYDQGRVSSILSIARDITEERVESQRAAQAEKLRALGQLASGVAHNFNNHLAAILGHTQLIKRACNDERIAQRLDIIERAALDGSETVKRIQGFGLQQDVASLEPVDLNQLVQDSANLTCARWRDDAQARGISYKVEMELATLPTVRGSASELREVFVNIILNALDAMPQGGRLRITTKVEKSVVKVEFTDSGIGMSEEVRARIFEPFFTTKSMTGTGLGLAVSHSIIERHGGRLEASSGAGVGSTFSITLPVASGYQKPTSRGRTIKVDGAHVLVIDDDERVREALVGMLGSASHSADQAASGPEGISKMEEKSFDLVFTDLSMPEMDGWAVAREIRSRWPGTKIVLITGHVLPPDDTKHNVELVDEIIFKPVQVDDISSTINSVLA